MTWTQLVVVVDVIICGQILGILKVEITWSPYILHLGGEKKRRVFDADENFCNQRDRFGIKWGGKAEHRAGFGGKMFNFENTEIFQGKIACW